MFRRIVAEDFIGDCRVIMIDRGFLRSPRYDLRIIETVPDKIFDRIVLSDDVRKREDAQNVYLNFLSIAESYDAMDTEHRHKFRLSVALEGY